MLMHRLCLWVLAMMVIRVIVVMHRQGLCVEYGYEYG